MRRTANITKAINKTKMSFPAREQAEHKTENLRILFLLSNRKKSRVFGDCDASQEVHQTDLRKLLQHMLFETYPVKIKFLVSAYKSAA